VDAKGSVHNKPENFPGGITVPLTGGGWVQITKDGIAIFDKDGNLVSSSSLTGSIHNMVESFAGGVIVPLAGGGQVQITDHGIAVFDKDGKLVSSLNTTGSIDNKPEVFNGGITIPLASGGKVTVDTDGVRVFDKDGNLVSSSNTTGSIHNKPESFSTISLPLANGNHIDINSTGLGVFDANGTCLGCINQNGAVLVGQTQITGTEVRAAKGTFGRIDPLTMERFRVSPGAHLRPGDVVVADPRHANMVRRSYRARDTAVLGVVAPGARMDRKRRILVVIQGSHGPAIGGSQAVATIRVDAAFGPIRPGDLLTSSSVGGYAMRATRPRLGTVIGKALGRLLHGKGRILVMVSPM
jgi:hypothetical protein